MGGPADGAGVGALPGLTSRSFFKRSVKLPWRAEKFLVPSGLAHTNREKNERYVGFSAPQDSVSVSELDLVLFYPLDDLHVLCVGNIASFSRRHGVRNK